MSMRLLGAMAGASGQALEAIKSRQDDEREVRRARMLEELRRDTATYLADYQDRLNSTKVDDKLSGFDPTTGEFVSRNNKNEELGRRKDAGMAKEYADKQEYTRLQLDAQRANIRQSDASANASNASAARTRKLMSLDGLEEGEGSKFSDTQRLAAVNKIEQNLESYGYNKDELIRAREKMLEGVRKGWSLDQFVEFERSYLEDSKQRGRTQQLSFLDAQKKIFGKPGQSNE